MASTTRKVIQSIEALASYPAGMTASELASITGMSWQGANRILEGLLEESVVTRDHASKKYQLGLRVCEWASATIHGRTAISIARKECVKLALETTRRIDFLILEGLYAVSVERYDPSDGIALTRFVSARRLWYESASGRIIVAYSPSHLRKAILSRTAKEPGLTPPRREVLDAELDEIARQGFALTPEHPGISTGLVVPIRDRTGFAVGALSTPFHASEMETEEGNRVLSIMKASSMTISQYLGFEDQVTTNIG